jgi:hypothetical protein
MTTPSSAAPRSTRPLECPNCHAALSPGARACTVCKLQVSQMAAFSAAKKAAQQRGFKSTQVETNYTPAWRSPATLIKTLCLLLVIGTIAYYGYHWFGPKPPRYAQFKPTPQEAVHDFLALLNAGDEAHFRAYQLIDNSARAGLDDPNGSFRQVFHYLNEYLSAELFKNWIDKTQLFPDPKDPNVITAKIDLETIHIRVIQSTPPDKMQKYGPRYGIVGIAEIDVQYAAELQKMAIIGDIIGNVAGRGSKSNFDSVLGASAANRHQPPFIKKIDLLNVLRDPRAANWRVVVQTDPLRTDPVIQARLNAILTDDRYDVTVQNVAKEVIDDKVTEEEKIAVGL